MVPTPDPDPDPAPDPDPVPSSDPLQHPLPEGSRFMVIFQEMARKAKENKDESMIQMTNDGYLLIVSDKGEDNFSCQAMDQHDQGIFMERLHASAHFAPPLKPPYSFAAIETFEKEHGVKIPYLLRHYMTQVSSESCCDPTRALIDLQVPPIKKVLVSKEEEKERKECMVMQFTDHKLVLLDPDMEGLIVTMDNETQGAFNPLWMSIFFPDRSSGFFDQQPKDTTALVQE